MEVAQITAEDGQAVDGIAVASVAASAESSCSSCCCPTNTSMETAKTIFDKGYTEGYICCPGAEQWFKFVATRTGQYTICTIGSLDTIGTLYDEQGNQLVRVDDYAPCGKLNFRIIRNLAAGETYYIKVGTYRGNVGSYQLRVTDKVLANYVTINKDKIVLVKGIKYELPITSNYTYKGYNEAIPLLELSVLLDPTDATEQEIWWDERENNILHVVTDFDDDGDRYIHVTATDNGITKLYAEDWDGNGKRDECTVYVGGAPVSGITLDRSSKTVSLNDTEQLTAIISPSNALNKGVTWNSNNRSVVTVDNNGVITGLKVGTATISATTNDGGYVATCIVTVDARPKVTIKEDNMYSHGDQTYFNIIFADGKVWENIGCDLSLDENRSGTPLWDEPNKEKMNPSEQRYIANDKLDYSASQLAFAYLCDPYGVEYYLREYSMSKHSKTLAEILWFKDEVFKEIFGCWPRLIKIFPDESVSYYEYSRSISDSTREDFWSDAEVLFGAHPIYDWLTFAQLKIAGLNLVVTTLLGMVSETLGTFISAMDLTKYLFFNGAIENAISSGESETLTLYVQDIINSSTTNKEVQMGLSKRFGAISAVVGAISMVINTGLFFPSSDELSVCNKVNSERLRASFIVNDEELSMQELIDCFEP